MNIEVVDQFMNIVEELGWPPVFLIPPRQFQQFDGESLGNSVVGIAAVHYPVISVDADLRHLEMRNTIYHEIAHHLWPHKPHWWIDVFGEVMAGGGGRGHWAKKYNKTADDLPPRKKLLVMARRQSEKLKTRYKLKRWNKRSKAL